MDIRKIDYQTAKNFIKDDLLIVKPEYDYCGYFINNELVSACGLEFKDTYTQIYCNYTAPEYRKKGYITQFIFEILLCLAESGAGLVKGNCLETSINIYKKLGFSVVGTEIYRGQTAYKVEKVI